MMTRKNHQKVTGLCCLEMFEYGGSFLERFRFAMVGSVAWWFCSLAAFCSRSSSLPL